MRAEHLAALLACEREKTRAVARTLSHVREGLVAMSETYGQLLAFVEDALPHLDRAGANVEYMERYVEEARGWLVRVKRATIRAEALSAALREDDELDAMLRERIPDWGAADAGSERDDEGRALVEELYAAMRRLRERYDDG